MITLTPRIIRLPVSMGQLGVVGRSGAIIGHLYHRGLAVGGEGTRLLGRLAPPELAPPDFEVI